MKDVNDSIILEKTKGFKDVNDSIVISKKDMEKLDKEKKSSGYK